MQQDMNALRERCKEIKKQQGITLAKIIEETNVPKSTVEAFFGSVDRQFRYETVKPIVKYMMQFDVPADEVDVPIPNPDLIEMYRTIIDIKNKSIDYLKEQVAYERTHFEEMKKSRTLFRTAFIVSIAVVLVFAYLFVDAMIGTFGMIRY
ncbi:MAG: hypothetical protein IIU73_05315 [Selenomonadales bacterium]|nr:hypothetical protein [Selenomonadales bacterium]